MTEIELITSWIQQPALLKEESNARLQSLRRKYPYFLPIYYLSAVQAFDYQTVPLVRINELWPANRVLTYQLFKQTEKRIIEEEDEEPLYPDKDLVGSALSQDYFSQQGIEVKRDLPPKESLGTDLSNEKDLMVVMSFSEWLRYLEKRAQKLKEEEASKSALRAMWQKQKLNEAMEEEEEEIPERVFEMAVNSITPMDELVSESMAKVYAIQGKKQKALEMYKKLSLQIPEKNSYFAKKIEELQKDLDL